MALDVIDISAEGLAAAYVVAEKPHRKTNVPQPLADAPRSARRLTECEAFLLRLGRKALELEGLRLVNAFRLCDNK
jgi:hypothetical protein